MNGPAVIVIAKTPVAGRVKTRCCPPCTPGQAASLAAAALTDTLAAVAACRASRRVVAIDGAPGPWLGAGFELVAQRGAGLGERIDNAFREVGCPALLIGMDTPQVEAATLDAALALLAPPIDAVVGPAVDGGFWALGLVAPIARLCAGIGMSSPTTCAHLRATLDRHGASWREVDELEDVDDFAAALRVAGDLPGSPYAAVVDRIAAELLTATRAPG
jgi:glycosyltransferase A (GT-A) superfamily protein (DUF2064 family)